MLVLAIALAAALFWGGFLYFSFRRVAAGARDGHEDEVNFQMQAAPWSDRHVESLLAHNPRSPTLLHQYVRNAIERKELPEALRRADMFFARAPRSPASWLSRSEAMRNLGHGEDALALLRKAARRFPAEPDVLAAWAREASGREDWAEAARRFERLRKRCPWRVDGYEVAADVLVRDGRPDEAEAVIAEGVRRLPDDWMMWQAAARIAERLGNPEEAIRRWEALRLRFPGEAEGALQLAEALAKAGRGEAAATVIRQARDYFPGHKRIAEAAARLAPPEETLPAGPESKRP